MCDTCDCAAMLPVFFSVAAGKLNACFRRLCEAWFVVVLRAVLEANDRIGHVGLRVHHIE